MVGVELAVAVFVNPIQPRQPAGPSLEARADGARVDVNLRRRARMVGPAR